MDRRKRVLDMHPYDAYDYVCWLLDIPQQEKIIEISTLLIYTWLPYPGPIDVANLSDEILELVDFGCRVGKTDLGGIHGDFIWAFRWNDDSVYAEVAAMGQLISEKLNFGNLFQGRNLRGAVGRNPYSALRGLRIGDDDQINIEEVTKDKKPIVV